MTSKYASIAAEYQVMDEVVRYLEVMITNREAEIERCKKWLAEAEDEGTYYTDRIEACTIEAEAYKRVQSNFIKYFD